MLAEIPEIDYSCVKVRETSRNQVLFAVDRNWPECHLDRCERFAVQTRDSRPFVAGIIRGMEFALSRTSESRSDPFSARFLSRRARRTLQSRLGAHDQLIDYSFTFISRFLRDLLPFAANISFVRYSWMRIGLSAARDDCCLATEISIILCKITPDDGKFRWREGTRSRFSTACSSPVLSCYSIAIISSCERTARGRTFTSAELNEPLIGIHKRKRFILHRAITLAFKVRAKPRSLRSRSISSDIMTFSDNPNRVPR